MKGKWNTVWTSYPRCPRKTLELARELGFQTYIDPEGYYGYAEIGQGENSWPFFVTWMLFQPVI